MGKFNKKITKRDAPPGVDKFGKIYLTSFGAFIGFIPGIIAVPFVKPGWKTVTAIIPTTIGGIIGYNLA